MISTQKRYFYPILALMVLVTFPVMGAAQEETGGTVGADFLLFPPATRTDALGGGVDGLEQNLEGIHFNPAILAPISDLQLQLNINPLPNDVMNSQLSVGIPMYGGLGFVGAQLLNTGGFTFVNATGQAEATVSVYDAAAVVGYSRHVWKTTSLGMNVKTVYRTLGGYNALAFATDLGGAAWFETPHIGQRPKPPTLKQLEKEFAKETSGIENENEKRLKEATKASAPFQKQVTDLEKELADLAAKIESAEEDKKEPFLQKESEAQAELQPAKEALAAAQVEEKDAVAAIDTWYSESMAAAQQRFEQKVADLEWIAAERQKLFAVIDDPEQVLTADMVDASIDSTIEKTRSLLAERSEAYQQRMQLFEDRRTARIEELRTEITEYETQVEEEVGPAAVQLNQTITTLREQRDALKAQEDADKSQIQGLDDQIKAKEKELQALMTDPWVKRLQSRILTKQNEIAEIEENITSMAGQTEKDISDATVSTEKDIQSFENLRIELQRELKKAKLKQELDVLEAGRERALAKAQRDYKSKEKKIYLRLLAATYEHEEKLFRDQLASTRDDATARRYDFGIEDEKSRESLDNDFAFKERFLSRKIAELKRQDGTEEEVASLEAELKEKETEHKNAVTELDRKGKDFDMQERDRLESEVQTIQDERQKIRLVYLQTDTPYLNTSINTGVRNLGTQIKFSQEGYPLPAVYFLSLSYALINTNNHNLKFNTQLNVPFHDALSVSVGVEYVFADLAFVRGGYTFGAVDRNFSAGLGAHLTLGFAEYSVDYTIRPLPENYGILHSIGVTIGF